MKRRNPKHDEEFYITWGGIGPYMCGGTEYVSLVVE